MILEALNELYDRLVDDESYDLPRFGFSRQKITFKVVVRPDGELVGIEDARTPSGNRLSPTQMIVPGNNKPSGSGINPCFLWDNAQYMLGFKTEDAKPERTVAAFQAFRDKHLALEDEIAAEGFSAVCRFLGAWDPAEGEQFELLTDAAATGFGVFQIVGERRFVHQLPEVTRWWEQREGDEEAPRGQCLVTGEIGPLARTHAKIRGVVGAQGAGGTIVGFNDTAYESYGKIQSFNAPVSERAAFRYVSAVNALLDGPRKDTHRFRLGDATVVFWTQRPSMVEDFFAQFAVDGRRAINGDAQDEAQLRRLRGFLDALRQGRERYGDLGIDPDSTRFYLLALAPNSARIAVRFFYRSSVADLIDNLRKHFQHIALVRRPPAGKWSGDPEFPSLHSLLKQTARTVEDIPPTLTGPLTLAVIGGAPYPHAVYAAVLRRARVERKIGYLNCCVLKGYLNRNLDRRMPVGLDIERPDPAYRMGRLFAALEKTQRDALGANLNKTIRDSFYSSASATPGSVFPRLLRTYQHHLAKLSGGLRVKREKLVQEILEPLGEFPAHLDLGDQGAFAIGYYHQTDAFYRKSEGADGTQEVAE